MVAERVGDDEGRVMEDEFADHAMSIARRVTFLVTGELLAKQPSTRTPDP
ncbi:hypothetical protein [Streptomyces sp. NPDC086777]